MTHELKTNEIQVTQEYLEKQEKFWSDPKQWSNLSTVDYRKQRKLYWRDPLSWSEEEINAHVEKTIGEDVLFPDRFYILVKLWIPPEVDDETGMTMTDHARYKPMISACVGQILRFGEDSFSEQQLFPKGHPYTYGEWVCFRSLDRQLFEVNRNRIAQIRDDKIVGFTNKPHRIKTSFDLEYEHVGS